jgi:regulator of sigma E protease
VRYIIPILGLLLLIFLHELGHFTAAKRTGMRALKFYIGFPPALLRKQVGETEYGIGAVPLGGFVKIPGMLRPEPSDLWTIEDIVERREQLPPERASEIAVANDELARLIGQGRVDEAAAAATRLMQVIDDTEQLSAADRRRARRCLERFVQSTDPRSYWRSPRRSRLIVIAAGPVANVLTSLVILSVLAVTGMPQPLQAAPVVAGVEKGLPGAKAGLRIGDRILAVDGHPIHNLYVDGHKVGDFGQVRALITGSQGRPLTLTVRRGGQTVQVGPITPVRQQGRYVVGFIPDVVATTRSFPLWKAPIEGASQMWSMISGSIRGISSEGTSSVSGPVGIVKVSASAADTGAPYYLWLLAYISLSLGILNLLPFLPLDGGHILLLALERLRGRALSRGTFERVSALGIALVLFLFLFGLHNDLFGAQPR